MAMNKSGYDPEAELEDPNAVKKPVTTTPQVGQSNSPLVDYGIKQMANSGTPTPQQTYAPDDYSLAAVQSRGGNTGVFKLPDGVIPFRDTSQDAHDHVISGNSGAASDPWTGIDPRLAKLYQDHGVMTPGAAGSGFKDAQYWNDTAMKNAGGDWNYISNRLSADLEGRGTDAPGSGDVGNTSRDPNVGRSGSDGFSTGAASGMSGPLWEFLQKRMNQGLNIDRKDPIIANQVNAFDAAQERGVRDQLRMQAEAAGPQGNLNQERRMAEETRGQNTGSFQASLMQNELNARRQEIQQALSGALGFVSDQQRMELEKQLAEMNNALQYAQLGQNAYQFDINDEYRRSPLAS